jgi:GTP cyclohydrolase III
LIIAVSEGKVDINHFEIVQKDRSDNEVQIREAFLIQKIKPEINKQMYQSGASYFVKIFT